MRGSTHAISNQRAWGTAIDLNLDGRHIGVGRVLAPPRYGMSSSCRVLYIELAPQAEPKVKIRAFQQDPP